MNKSHMKELNKIWLPTSSPASQWWWGLWPIASWSCAGLALGFCTKSSEHQYPRKGTPWKKWKTRGFLKRYDNKCIQMHLPTSMGCTYRAFTFQWNIFLWLAGGIVIIPICRNFNPLYLHLATQITVKLSFPRFHTGHDGLSSTTTVCPLWSRHLASRTTWDPKHFREEKQKLGTVQKSRPMEF